MIFEVNGGDGRRFCLSPFTIYRSDPTGCLGSSIINHQSAIIPQSAIRNPQSAIRNPQSAIRNPQSAIRNPQSAIRNLFSVESRADQ
jgi:hypothetical protein